jgi:DNA repair protein RadC
MKTIYKSAICEKTLTVSERKSDFIKKKITTSQSARDYIKQFYFDDIEIYESFFLLLLNVSGNTIGYVKIGQGGTSSTVVDVKIVAKYCIETLAASVILGHNHPSGTTTPSENDKTITNTIKNTLSIFGCKVLDHIILTGTEQYYSFADEGLI